MRPIRIVGTLFVIAAVLTFFLWTLNTLVPIQRASRLQPLESGLIASANPGQTVLLECRVGPKPVVKGWQTSGLPLDCAGVNVRVRNANYYLQSFLPFLGQPASTQPSIAPSDPVVVIGKLTHNNAGSTIEADVLAYGSRHTYLNRLQDNSFLLIIVSYVVGAVGLVILLIDWRLAKQAKQRKAKQAMRKMLEMVGRD